MENLKTYEECQEVNRNIGHKYLELGSNVKKLIARFEEHERKGDVEWDFPRLKTMYADIEARFNDIGTKLIKHNAKIDAV